MPNPIKKTRPADRNSQSNTSPAELQYLKICDANLPICPECGAKFTSAVNCKIVFDECLAREFSDPNFGNTHHLTDGAYMLQHSSKLSREGWVSLRKLLREFLVLNKSPLEISKLARSIVDSGNRNWKISSHDSTPFIDRRIWTKTIMGVHRDEYKTYCADISDWARIVLTDSEAVAW
ncbi:MAG: DUF5946 family protein [Chloroflexota bacterium]